MAQMTGQQQWRSPSVELDLCRRHSGAVHVSKCSVRSHRLTKVMKVLILFGQLLFIGIPTLEESSLLKRIVIFGEIMNVTALERSNPLHCKDKQEEQYQPNPSTDEIDPPWWT